MIYCCVLTVHNTLYKFVSTQRDGLYQMKINFREFECGFNCFLIYLSACTSELEVRLSAFFVIKKVYIYIQYIYIYIYIVTDGLGSTFLT